MQAHSSNRLRWSLAVLVLAATALQAGEPTINKKYPQQILIIRHAEKPAETTPPDVHLAPKGKERAKKLHELFERKGPDAFPMPQFIFATHNSTKSHRPKATVKDFAEKYNLPINDTYHNNTILDPKGTNTTTSVEQDKGLAGLAKEVFGNKQYFGKTILICWHHGTIPELAGLLKATGYPAKWDTYTEDNVKEGAFDRVWVITYDDNGKTTFADRPQRLMKWDHSK